ncbi:MAG: outer membrane lipoprotein chaperone LolA [Xanthomonadales bacterium]|nr:Outer-membrane lipoprotein carrier protein [Xanthomonadales bacterium]MCC6592446.1 outer membrane lipoprotein chaperone LolA [Xanthomonadales bacterium]MCE7931593.1 outer membrane lipoprotein carrier protein LolA [Xanthomonadales bacterium PRO6]
MRTIAILIATLGLATAAHAAGSAREQLDRFGERVQNLSASFEQQVYDADGRSLDAASGTLALARPNRFRWDYLEPEEQRIVADGDHIWVYDVELEQVSVRPQAVDEQSSPLAVLLDLRALDQQFRSEERPEEDGNAWMRLTPRAEEAEFAHVDLAFRDHELKRMVMVDIVGQRTEIVFQGWRRNIALAAGTFRFDPPPGVDVVGDLRPGAQVQPIPD